MATLHLHNLHLNPTSFESSKSTRQDSRRPARSNSVHSGQTTTAGINRVVTVSNGNDTLDIFRVLNGMWQTSGAWGKIDRDDAVEAMLRYVDAGLSTFDMADHYGPAENLYGIFINRVRNERPPELVEKVRGLTKWVLPPVKIQAVL